MGTFIFCRDGVLRLREYFYDSDKKMGGKIDLPLFIIEQIDDKYKFLKCLGELVEFEDGLTVKEFFNNLAPWAEIMEGLACMDFPAFLTEVNKPCEKPLENISHIEIMAYYEFSVRPDFERVSVKDMFEKVPGKKYSVLKPMSPIYTNEIELEYYWRYTAKLETPTNDDGYECTEVGLDYSPINEWAHVPMKFAKNVVYDRTINSDYSSFKESLFNSGHPSFKSNEYGAIISISTPPPTFFHSILRGFLWEIGFHYSPVKRDKLTEELKQQIKEIDDDLEQNEDIDDIMDDDKEEYIREPDEKEIYLKLLINNINKIDPTLIRVHEKEKND